MAIITISRGSFSMGTEVAVKVAERLNYDLVSREVLLDASERFKVPEIKLTKAIHDAPGILERYNHTSYSYIAYIRAALTERVARDNVIYHGLAGHVLLKGIPNVLKVRITTDLASRIAREIKEHGGTEADARALILEDDRQRRKWTQSLYGEDPWDCSLYDLVFRVEKLSVENAIDFICTAASAEKFRTTAEDQRKIADIVKACRVKAALVDEYPDIGVTCDYGNILVYSNKRQGSAKLRKKLDSVCADIDDIYNAEVHTGVIFPEDAV